MSGRMRKFFVLEASDYLTQIDELVGEGGEAPPPEDLARLCRALRGTARLHREEGFAAVAGAMEEAGEALGEGDLAWSEELRQAVARSVEGLRSLLREDVEDPERRVEALLREWEELAPGARRREGGGAVEAGTREGELAGFVMAELGAIQEAVGRAERALREGEAGTGALEEVLDALAPLAGAAWLDRFPGLTELVERIEEVARKVARAGSRGRERATEFFERAAVVAGEIAGAAEGGPGEPPEGLEAIRSLANAVLDEDGEELPEGAVPIEELFHDDEGPHVLSRAGDGGEELPLEVRNFFRIEATSLVDRAEKLVDELREGGGRAGRELADAFSELARIFQSFQFGRAAGAARALAGRAGEVEEGPDTGARIAAAMPDLRAVVDGIDDREEVEERARRIEELLEVEAPGEPAAETPAAVVTGAEETHPEGAPASAGGGETPQAPPPRETAVPIEELVYSGDAALRRALDLTPEVERALDDGDLSRLRDHLDEIFDLIAAARG